MNSMTPDSAFIFDLDGVIADTARLHGAAWQTLAQSLGLPCDGALLERLKGVSREDSLDMILRQGARSYSVVQRAALAEAKNAHYLRLLDALCDDDLLPGARGALQSARAAGHRVGLASASRNAGVVLERLGIAGLFDHVVDAAAIACGKPDPEIFHAAARALGCPAGRCVGIEDAVAGVAAIKAAGMYAIGIGDPQHLPQADRVLPDLRAFDPGDYLPAALPT